MFSDFSPSIEKKLRSSESEKKSKKRFAILVGGEKSFAGTESSGVVDQFGCVSIRFCVSFFASPSDS